MGTTREFNINQRVAIEQIDRKLFRRVFDQYRELGKKLERFATPPPEHRCDNCPIDPHTMRYVVLMLAHLRNASLSDAMNTQMSDAAAGYYRFAAVNTLDLAIAAVCGEFAPELGEDLMENYT